MKTKLLAITMMGITALGSIGGLAMANTDFSNTEAGFGGTVGVQGVAGIVGTKDASGQAANDGLLQTVKKTINWILGMLALIALAICLWGGFQMVTAAGDDNKYKAGMKVLKHAAIGLIVVGISWLVVSFIFWLIGTLATTGSAPNNQTGTM